MLGGENYRIFATVICNFVLRNVQEQRSGLANILISCQSDL